MWKADDPFSKVSGGAYDYFNDMGMPDLLKSIDKVDDYTVKFTLNQPEAPFIANMAMDFAAIHSKEYMDAMMKAGTPEQVDQAPIGTGPFQFRRLPKGRGDPLQGEPGLFPRQAKDRRARLRHHSGCDGANCQIAGRRMPDRAATQIRPICRS